MINCQAFKFNQGKDSYYMCLIKAKELLRQSKIDIYDSVTNVDGYQRSPQLSRAKRFAKYLMKCKGSFNSTFLLNIRERKQCKFIANKIISKNLKIGKLRIYDILNVVDGQHRLKGLEIAIKEGYSKECLVPALITRGKAKREEALSFLVVNRTAKGIKADLTDELIYRTIHPEKLTDDLKEVLGLTIERNIGEFARSVGKTLNDNEESVWYKKISLPNERVSKDKGVNLKTFSDSLVKAINSCSYLRRAANLGDIDTVTKLLTEYWQAISKVCPKATSLKWNKFALLRSSGTTTMNRLFGRVLDDGGIEPSFEKFVKSLEKMPSLDDDVWHLKEGDFGKLGTGKKGLKKAYSTLEMELDRASLR